MAWLMRVAGYPDGRSTPHDGEFLRSVNLEANHGFGLISTTPNPRHARKFQSLEEGFGLMRSSPLGRLFRPDGKPNRPLTATNWEFIKEEDV